ncbi:MAG: hypothetical protein RL120_06240 [Gammaproteobacteria bacterium]
MNTLTIRKTFSYLLTLILGSTVWSVNVLASEDEISIQHLRQQALELKREWLTATADERAAVTSHYDEVMLQFDRRIARLQSHLADNADQLAANTRDYTDSLMRTLVRERRELAEGMQQLRAETSQEWDHIVHSFMVAYDPFFEAWEDAEAQIAGLGG